MRTAPGSSFLQRWLHAVYASKLTTAERDTLCAYSAFMNPSGLISVRRRTISEITRRPERKVQEHVSNARRAGLLLIVDGQAPGRAMVYQAAVPADLNRRP